MYTQPIENGSIVNWSNRIIKWNSDGTLLGTFDIETGSEAFGTSYSCMIQFKRITYDRKGICSRSRGSRVSAPTGSIG